MSGSLEDGGFPIQPRLLSKAGKRSGAGRDHRSK